jgi:hypothetical protein
MIGWSNQLDRCTVCSSEIQKLASSSAPTVKSVYYLDGNGASSVCLISHCPPILLSSDGKTWFTPDGPMHSCFAWVGTGAFTAKSHVLHFLSTSSSSSSTPPSSPSYSDSGLLYSLHDNSSISPPYTSQELAHADNSFTTLLNKPPYVLSSSRLDQLPSKFGHSDGEGIERNKRFIVRQPSLFLFSSFRCCNETNHSSCYDDSI